MIHRAIVSIARYNIRASQTQSRNFFLSTEKDRSGNTKPPTQQTSNSQHLKKNEQENEYKQEEDFKYQQENRNTVQWMIWRVLVWGSLGIFSYNCYLVAHQTKEKKAADQLGAVPGFLDAARTAYKGYSDMMEVTNSNIKLLTQPPVKKLLADPLHPAIQYKTLCLNVSGTLISTDFIIGKGMTLKRRPGLQQFLNKLPQMYEVVIFSDDDFIFLNSVITTLDPRQQIFMGAFGRQCMIWYEGQYIKDLKYLNRDPKNIIVIDKNINNLKKHPSNAIILKQFHGQEQDNQLIKLLPLLENLASPQIKDVRKVIQKMGDRPHEKFYEKMKDKQEKIKAKQSSGLFGLFSKSKKEQKKE